MNSERRHSDAVVERKITVRHSPGGGALVVLLLLVAAGIFYYAYHPTSTLADMFHDVKVTAADTASTSKVRTALLLSKHVSPYDIKVETTQGEVTLTGQVPSAELKSMAGAIAKDTSGVKEVHNELTVNPAAARDAEMEGLSDRVQDLEIKIMVANEISKNAELKDGEIGVQVKRGEVTLNGKVDTTSQKSKAEIVALSVSGVQKVQNQLRVENADAAPDSADVKLARKVEFELYSTRALSLNSMQIQAADGTVTLSGSVGSRAEKLLAEKVARSVAGVKRVENNLSVPEAQQR